MGRDGVCARGLRHFHRHGRLAAAGLVPKSPAIIITILVTVVSIVALLLLLVWGMSVVGQWLIRNGSQFQTLYPTSTG